MSIRQNIFYHQHYKDPLLRMGNPLKAHEPPQAFSQKMKRGKYSLEELEEIAVATGVEIHCYFELPNGEKIVLK